MKWTRIVVGGTDTDVGKTRVSIGLLRALCASGRNPKGVKPIESGVDVLEAHQEDGVRLAQATGQDRPSQALIRLGAPIAPPAAAEAQGVSLDWEEMIVQIKAEIEGHEVALIEGAGGLLSPLTWEETTVDLALALDAVLWLVVSDRLGAINQARMAFSAAQAAGVAVAAIVFSETGSSDPTTGENLAGLARCPEFQNDGAPELIQFPHLLPDDSGEEVFRAGIQRWVL